MSDQTEAAPAYPTDADIDEVLTEFGGDYRQAIAALLHDLDALSRDYETSVSRGYVRAIAPATASRVRV